ncbi:MAG: hypothetical protein ACYS18_06515 [Planctomycetota bacterium]|jgi:hypothetical protein
MSVGSKETFIPLISFVIVVFLHGSYHIMNPNVALGSSSQVMEDSSFTTYFSQNNYMLGISYGLAVGFTFYAIMKFSQSKKYATMGLAGGLTLSGFLYAGGCFILGCCGSPMLSVYISLFGTQALGFRKPLVLFFTALSVGLASIWLRRKTAKSADLCTGVSQKSCLENDVV